MKKLLVDGVFAAVLVPRDGAGRIDTAAYGRAVAFLLERGVRGVVVNGATGEYPLTTDEEFAVLVELTAAACGGRAPFLCGVGSAGLQRSVGLGRRAMEGGAAGLLVPVPYFFPYEQDDVEAYYQEFASRLAAPSLLYNLPSFTTPIERETVLRVLDECPTFEGIKDSSGQLEIVGALTAERPQACRVIGNDGVLSRAMEQGLCDGVISGVAGVLPELLTALWESVPGSPEFAAESSELADVVSRLGALPTPWALKWILESRGVAEASFAQPLSARRAEQGRALRQHFSSWRQQAPAQGCRAQQRA